MRLVIVDDDVFALRALARALHEPSAIATGLDEGLRLVGEHRPAVAVFDRSFLGDQRTATDEIGEIHRLCPECQVMIVSGLVDPEDRRRALRCGAAGYFTKGEVEVLRAAVGAVLDDEEESGGGAMAMH